MEERDEAETSEVLTLRAEVSRLREEVVTLRETTARIAESEERFLRLSEASLDGVGITERGIMVELNRRMEEMLGFEPGAGIGTRVVDFMAPGSREEAAARIRAGDESPYEGYAQRLDGTTFPASFHGKSIVYRGRPARVTVIHDLTAQKQAEEFLREAVRRDELIRAQDATLAALTVPLLPILDGVVLMPLVGALSPARAERVVDALCQGVVTHAAHLAILDITGLLDVDASVVEALARAARTVELLGAIAILTGIGPQVAAEMVRLNLDLRHIKTMPTLARGVAHALALRRSGALR
jgi:rsbT co-antagonist protein RsbR